MDSTLFLTYRRDAGDPARGANLLAVLEWLASACDTDVVVVEQDACPTLTGTLPNRRCQVVFAYNPGPFNKAWGLNVGVRLTRSPVLVFSDADLIVPEVLPRSIQLCAQGYGVVKPYRRLHDLTPEESRELRSRTDQWQSLATPGRAADRGAIGEHLVLCGGLFAIRRDVFMQLGGWDERFIGWGGEDDALTYKVQRKRISTLELDEVPALHLWHPRPHAQTLGQPHYAANKALLAGYRALPEASFDRMLEVQRQLLGHREKYRPEP